MLDFFWPRELALSCNYCKILLVQAEAEEILSCAVLILFLSSSDCHKLCPKIYFLANTLLEQPYKTQGLREFLSGEIEGFCLHITKLAKLVKIGAHDCACSGFSPVFIKRLLKSSKNEKKDF